MFCYTQGPHAHHTVPHRQSWDLVILQISTCKNVATKYTIPQNTEIFGLLGSKYQIITRLGHQDENRPYKVSKYLFK